MDNAPFSLLIKPVSADCNQRCGYCFYREKKKLYPAADRHRMAPAVLEKMIRGFLRLDLPRYAFGWQGGEPTLAGLDFFRNVVRLQRRFGRPGARVCNSLQTNGALLDDEWCAFLAENRFLAGLSIDGPEALHNAFRKGKKGEPVFRETMRAVERLGKHQVEFNALTVINAGNAGSADKVYGFLKGLGIRHHQYIPAVVPLEKAGQAAGFEITGEQYGRFLLDLFGAWHPADTRDVSIRFFDSIINKMVLGRASQCDMAESCDGALVVEYNGDVYPCDFFVEEKWRLGNLGKASWKEMREGEAYGNFARMKGRLPPGCGGCGALEFCFGDCTRRRSFAGNDFSARSPLCGGIRRFLDGTLEKFKALARTAGKNIS